MKTLLTHPWILGTILGDTDIDPLGRMYCAQSLRQESYLLCKCHQLQDMGALAPNAVVKKRAQIHSGRTYYTIRSKAQFLELRAYF